MSGASPQFRAGAGGGGEISRGGVSPLVFCGLSRARAPGRGGGLRDFFRLRACVGRFLCYNVFTMENSSPLNLAMKNSSLSRIPMLALFAALMVGGCGYDSYDPASGGAKIPLQQALDDCNAETDRDPEAENVREAHDQCMLGHGWQAN